MSRPLPNACQALGTRERMPNTHATIYMYGIWHTFCFQDDPRQTHANRVAVVPNRLMAGRLGHNDHPSHAPSDHEWVFVSDPDYSKTLDALAQAGGVT
jgi:hypothetical protein